MIRWKISKFKYKYGSFHKVPNKKAISRLETEMDVLSILQRNGESFCKTYTKWLEKEPSNFIDKFK
jgi:hypothetical protein